MTYSAYLRIYEPVVAFHEPDRSRWAAYAVSPARPRRRDSLMAEHAEALRRTIMAPQIVVPDRESEHAYVRRADGITYVCPWQTRLRILLAWFVPFTAPERWLSLGPDRDRPSAAATASAMRALVYTTPMSRARRRVARGLATLRCLPPRFNEDAWEPLRAEGDLADVRRWLEEFHPYSLVELDYGGLVHLLSDDALCGDQSVAEVGAAIEGAAKGERELAVAMYMRAHSRWRAFAEVERAN